MTLRGSYWLFNEFVSKDLGRTEDHHREAFKAILSLFLSSASRLRHFVDGDNNLKDAYKQEITLAINGFYTQLSGVFIKIYGQSFGGCGYNFYELSSKSELKVQICFH